MILRNFFEKYMKYFCNKLNFFVTMGVLRVAYLVSRGESYFLYKKERHS